MPERDTMADNDFKLLLSFAKTNTQRKHIEACVKYGSTLKAAAELNTCHRSMQRTVARVKAIASDHGYIPSIGLTKPVPIDSQVGYKGASVLTKNDDPNDDVRLVWNKYDVSAKQRYDAVAAAIDAKVLSLPVIPKISPAKNTLKELCSLYTITDYHLGMYAWDKEAGDNWNIDIARNTLVNTISELMENTPNAEQAILNIQGDFLHWDGLDAVTPQHGHVLDAAGRLAEMVDMALDLVILMCEMMLKKHKKVKLIVCEGNHDMSGSVWLQKCMKRLFSKNPRMEVDDTPFPYYAHLHGKIMLGFHHGHKKKNKDLPALFASEPRYREMWGQAIYTYIHTGHYHQTEQDMAEAGGAIVERHPTLAARDAYAVRGGYVSWRAARAITYHETDGESGRTTKPPRYKKEE